MDKKGKHVSIRVIFLDDQLHAFQIHIKAFGHVLWEAVVRHLSLIEADYFDLEYTDSRGIQTWLDREKAVLKQLPNADTPLRFLVKFYTPDPALLEDELTRYLYGLQIKKDLATGALTCSDNTMALLASYIAQAEVGDFPIEEYTDHTYLRANNLRYVPNQTEELEKKIMEYHKQHVGETPSEADVNLLDTARKVELYGIRMVPAKDHENVSLNLAISHSGILVFQGLTKINTFSWAKIRKLSFKRKRLLIKLHPENYGYYKDLVEFFFDSRDECKIFWKKCIEHHGFFRCQRVKTLPRNKTRVVSRGSSFRYSGRTQKQLSEYIRENFTGKRPQFERTVSGRISSRSSSVTPKIPAKASSHNSADLHNTSASSGSHILDQSSLPRQQGSEVVSDAPDIHSESSMSGSRSLNSPKLEHVHSLDAETPQHQAPVVMVKEGSQEGVVTIVTEPSQQVVDEKGACSYNFTNILNINTNLDEVEVNENYLNVVGTSHTLSSPSANQNANDNDRSQSQESYLSEGYDAEIEQTNSISLPSDLKVSSTDQSDSISSDVKGQGIDQSDHSLHSDLSVEEMAEIETCLQTISNAGCADLDSIVENVVEPLLSLSKTNITKTQVVTQDLNIVKSEFKISERAIVDGSRTVGEWVNECKNNVDNALIEDIDSKVSGNILEHEQYSLQIDTGNIDTNITEKRKHSLTEDNGIEPSSCILAAVESKLGSEEGKENKSQDELNKSVIGDSDLFEDIPYFLHRRHVIGDTERKKETELYTALINALNQEKSESRSRRSRSMRRAPNLLIEQLKADEIPFQPRSLSLPSKRTVSKSPGRKSPSDAEISKSDKTRSRRAKSSHSRSSQSRSPSGNRMIVNYHSLPRKDNYSSVDDTASPTEEVDVFTQFTKHRATSPSSFKGEFRSASMELHSESYIEPSPITDNSVDESFGLTQTTSESDSLRGLSDGSMSLTHSSFSINESETSQGSYSLSDLNLSRDDIANEMEKMDSFDGGEHKTEKIKLEDLDLPFIDAFDESDIAENQLSSLQMSNIMQQSEPAKEKETVNEIEEEQNDIIYSNSAVDNEYEDDRVNSCPYSDVMVTEGVCNFSEPEKVSIHTRRSDKLHSLHMQDSVDIEETSETRSPKVRSAKPVLKPLEIPQKLSWKKTPADDEWESLLQQLKDDDNDSPDDLNPADLLLSLSSVRSGSNYDFPKPRKPMNVEESEIEELDRLLLETTKFNSSERENDPYNKYTGCGASARCINSDSRHFRDYEPSDLNFSTFKPMDSPSRSTSCSSSSRSLYSGSRDSVITVSLSHDIEDIQMEEKPICAFVYQKDQECRLSASSLSSPRHAIIRRSPSPSRLMEYNAVGHREFKVSNDENDLDLNKRHSYHGETSESIDAKERRKRLEPKRVSFHETVEEITTEAYQSSSSSSDDKSGGDKESDVLTPDTMESGATSDLCYDGDTSSQNAPDDSAGDTNESDTGKTDNDSDDSDENETSDEEYSDKDEEFLKFAQRLSECGKDGAADSGIGDSVTNTTEVSPSEPLRHGKHLDEKITETENENYVNGSPVIHIDQFDKQSLQSFENDSSSSDSDLAPEKKDKRPSVDPLESLEQLHDSYVSSSEESSEGETNSKVNFSD